MKLLVTGGVGFIGSNFIRHIRQEHPDWEITNLDKLTYAGNLENLKDIQDQPGYHFVKGDIADRKSIDKLLGQGFDVIVNFAAESHVDRSILDASPFIETNVKGTQVLLEGAKKHGIQRFIQVSTDLIGQKPGQAETQTAGQNSYRKFVRVGGRQYKLHMGWWLLECLEQGVETVAG